MKEMNREIILPEEAFFPENMLFEKSFFLDIQLSYLNKAKSVTSIDGEPYEKKEPVCYTW
ncbi:MAG TPA: hypothetical protein PK200_11315 [Spirochaetota bacterium]|nr:hypothetical protein [Spirochaetota bacterium]HQP50479.1 hypothetical protein [Spirochaetota bacterium]